MLTAESRRQQFPFTDERVFTGVLLILHPRGDSLGDIDVLPDDHALATMGHGVLRRTRTRRARCPGASTSSTRAT